jgi:Uma2 family endonuclease
VLLLVEVAETSLAKARGVKRALYASFGVREYWVVDAATLVTWVHRDLRDGQYREVVEVAADELVTPELVPGLAVRMGALGV